MNKVLRKLKEFSNTYRGDKAFSIRLANYRLLDNLCWRVHLIKISDYFHEKKDEWILKYLEKKLEHIIRKYENSTRDGIYIENSPLWVCWWTGEDNAPDLVKQCIKSIRNNAGNHPVNMITKNNYESYLEVPSCFLEKVESGEMCVAHFADYMRVSLLEKYGGLWLDATIFCINEIPEEYFEKVFFTCKSKYVKCRYISGFRWTGFCLGGWKQNLFYSFMREALEEYWSSEKSAIDYLFMDYLFEIAYRRIPSVREYIDAVELNNLNRDDLQAAMNNRASAEDLKIYMNRENTFYKLSWREKYSKTTLNEEKSIYAEFINMEL